jgi:hypothetical protein
MKPKLTACISQTPSHSTTVWGQLSGRHSP